MYSLPIATYTDFWRGAKNRSLYIGSGLLLAGTTVAYIPANINLDSFPQRISPQVQPVELKVEEKVGEKESGMENRQISPIATDIQIVDIEIPASTEFIESDQLVPGTSKVKEAGDKGIERRIIKTTRVNGEITSERITHQFMLEAPKKRVVIRNSQPAVEPKSQGGFDVSQLNVQKVMNMEATAYTFTGYQTATGVNPREGIIAVDPRVIPLGSQVYVEGYGYAIAADTGGVIKGNIIDVFFPSLQRCISWGRRPVTVYILNGK